MPFRLIALCCVCVSQPAEKIKLVEQMGCGTSKDQQSPVDHEELTFELLSKQDDRTSDAVIRTLRAHPSFHTLSQSEGNDIVKRDQEDDAKLAVGIQVAIDRGVLPKDPHVAPTTRIHVHGKQAGAVADEILSRLPSLTGNVVVLQGLSGTGKGTTVKLLQQKLPHCVCWSNGNVFRALTHLASKHCEDHHIEFSKDVLTSDLIQGFVRRLSFVKVPQVAAGGGSDDEVMSFDVLIDNTTQVSEIQNTVLKAPTISSRVPTVAEQTQGEVVVFAAKAVETLKEHGCNVVLEGRAQTLNYIPTPLRFELVMDDVSLLGQRRAAQRVMAAAYTQLKSSHASGGDSAVTPARVREALVSVSDVLV